MSPNKTHNVSSLDSGRLLQCMGALAISFAGITAFDPNYWFTYTILLAFAGVFLLMVPFSSKFTAVMERLDSGKKSMPSGPNHRERKAEKKAEREQEKKAARASNYVKPPKGRPSEAQIELIKKEQERRQKGARPRSRSTAGRAEMS